MAFPTTSILDSGTGADANPIAGNWAGPSNLGDHQIQRSSNRFKNGTAGGGGADSYWNAATFGPDMEAFFEVVARPTQNNSSGLFVRAQNLNTGSESMYFLFIASQSAGGSTLDGWQLAKLVSGVYTNLGASVTSPNLNGGDAAGLEIIGNVLTAYKRVSGVWSAITSQTDSSVTGTGKIVLYTNDLSTVFNCINFGGGTVVAATRTPINFLYILGQGQGMR